MVDHWLLLGPAFVAGVINSIAGGGTLLTFPSLLAFGLPAVTANATSTVALVPGSAAAMWGYRHDLSVTSRRLAALAIPSVVGGVLGAWLTMIAGDALFARLVPWLILVATVLFLAQGVVAKRSPARNPAPLAAVMVFQLVVSVYGGFFGAGMGILILAALGALGMKDVHDMNAVKSFTAVCINGVASVTFIAGGRVDWPLAGLMAVGAIGGGYVGARVARKVGQIWVRRAVVAIGFVISAVMFVRQL